MQAETASGNWHLWFRLPEGIAELRTRIGLLSLPIDVKATGIVLMPGSSIGGKEYRFRDGRGFKRPEDLVLLPESLLALVTEQRTVTTRSVPLLVTDRDVQRLRHYVRHAVAHCHAGAHNTTFRVACKIASTVGDFALAMEILREWNATNAVDKDGRPYPWSEAELLHKMTDAFRTVRD
jgi:hypothetical protein